MYEPKLTSWTGVFFNEIASFILVATSPLLLIFYFVAYEDFNSSLTAAGLNLVSEGPWSFFSRCPLPTTTSIAIYLLWVAFQAALYVILPGRLYQAPRTPGGRRLLYRLNGTNAWVLTVIIAVAASYYELVDPAFIAKNWGSLFAAANVYSCVLVFIFQIKARVSPDNEGDTMLNGQFWYTLFNGGELHPRTGALFDWKHFNASRSGGILLWTLIDLSFAAWQYERFGYLTNSMILAVALRVGVVWDYFNVEHWFFDTLDGAHERFSFYSIYGFAAMMPHLWTLQTQYLAVYPVHLSNSNFIAITVMFMAGAILNHVANRQKSKSRQTAGNLTIWGQKAKYLEATFQTADGKTHRTILLCSGFWGYVRHANYLGSGMYTLASCLLCGTGHIFPYTEAMLAIGMIIHRCLRDEARCKEKYGKTWDEYCRLVKWRIIPGIY